MIVFDTETTGLPEADGTPLDRQPKIIEIACIKFDRDWNELGRFERLVNPQAPLPDIIKKITGLTDQDLEDQPPFAGIYDDLCEFFLGETRMLAHNVNFDRQLLKFDLLRIGKLMQFPWPKTHICTVQASRPLGIKKGLANLYHHAFKEDFPDAHRAMPDTVALARYAKWCDEKGML
jgi:DNA polymerase III subunit epsilon